MKLKYFRYLQQIIKFIFQGALLKNIVVDSAILRIQNLILSLGQSISLEMVTSLSNICY
jgi:hypothetical protein